MDNSSKYIVLDRDGVINVDLFDYVRDPKEFEFEQKSVQALKKLSEYSWPGNVRQLENTCYWLALMAPSKDIQPSDLPQDILDGKVLNPSSDDWRDGFKAWIDGLHETTQENLLESIEPEIDKLLIEFALDKTNGKKQEAAKLLGLGRNTLAKKIKEING